MKDSIAYLLGWKKIPMDYGPKYWKTEWFPDWFLKIEQCFDKVKLPQPDIRLDYLLNKEYVYRNAKYLVYSKNKDGEKHFEALKTRGINAILDGECPARISNFTWYSRSAINPKIEEGWVRVRCTDNYGKPIDVAPKNEFENTKLLNKLAIHLDQKLLDWHNNEEWFNDMWDELEKEYWQKLKE